MARTKPNATAPQQRRRIGPGRSLLRKAAGDRGHRLYNIWYHYSARHRRDVVLNSNPEFDHFCWLEGDPEVTRYELQPEPLLVNIDRQWHRTQFDAKVEFRNAPPELREIKDSEDELRPDELIQKEAQKRAAIAVGLTYRRITREDLAQHQILIVNWRSALAYLTACREIFLESHAFELRATAKRARTCTLEELLQETDQDLRPEYLAALFQCLQAGELNSDMATKPLCNATVISHPEVCHG